MILHFEDYEKNYLPAVKGILSGRAQVRLNNSNPTSAFEFVMASKQFGGCPIISSSQRLLSLVAKDATNPRLSEYAGSILEFAGTKFLFVDPLEQLVTTSTGKHVFKRYTDKFVSPDTWLPTPDFKWEMFDPSKVEEYVEYFDNCDLIGIDIETPRDNPERGINCISFSGARLDRCKLSIKTLCIDLTAGMFEVVFTRLLLSSPVAKVFQNGKYDIAYLLRYGCPVTNYAFDTINLFHSWFSELPKDLGFINSYLLRDYIFHKNDGKSGDRMEYYRYNAKDAFTTVLSCLALLMEIPEYAERNYLMEFPVVFPSILMEHTGMKWDSAAAEKAKQAGLARMELRRKRLGVLVGAPGFNPNSPAQTLQLVHALGSKDIKSSDEKNRDKVSSRHPLNEFLMKEIDSFREDSKEVGAYYKDSIPWLGRCFYALNPHGTDTGRIASRESQFWCGLQIQNIKRDTEEEDRSSVKECLIADPDFFFGEADYSQAETWDTAYLSGDTALIDAVHDKSHDFHGSNASAFFGIPYEEIVKTTASDVLDEEGNLLFVEYIHKTVNKVIRDLSKRTNHGANYNMGAQVMLDTMGIKKVLRAKELLGLPTRWSLINVCEHLLAQFDKRFPVIRDKKGGWYAKVINDVNNTGLLVGPTGWTRRCFGSPDKNKRHLNSYVAHPPQSLNAMTLNKAVLRVFREIALVHPKDFKLCAQIHDSILFQYRKSMVWLAYQVLDCMRIEIPVTDTFGITRNLIVPADLKGNATRWSDVESIKVPRNWREELALAA
jgi:DNA polymerase family A/3'-5' exonuclease